MKRVNLKVLLGLIAGLAVAAVGVYGLNRFQVDRSAGLLAKLARQRLAEGKTGEAMSLFQRYLGFRPNDVAVHREYADLVLAETRGVVSPATNLQWAYNSLEEAVRRNPDDDHLRLDLAEFQVRMGRFIDAREHLETLRSRVGKRAAASGEDPSAETAAEKSEAIDPTKVQLLLAQSLGGTGDFEAAARLAADLVGFDVQQRAFDPDIRPVDATEPYALLGLVLEERLDDPAAAALVFEELGRRRTEDADAWVVLARWHEKRRDYAAATAAMKRASDIAPDDPNVVWGGFELALTKGDIDEAKAIATRASELFPEDERVYRGLAETALRRGDLAAAEDALREGVAKLPVKPMRLMLLLADILIQQRKFDETELLIEEIDELAGGISPALELLQCRVLMARQSWAQARRRLEDIRPLAAANPGLTRQIDFCLSQCYERLEEFDEQLDVSRRILVDDPTSLAARASQAAAKLSSGKTDEALEEFETLAASIPADRLPGVPQVWYPLLQLRTVEQLKRPVADRDWGPVDRLLAMLEQSPVVSASQLAILRSDILARKGDAEAALDLLEKATRVPDAEPQVWAGCAQLALRVHGAEAARDVLARMPAALIDDPAIMPMRMQLAARAAPDEAAPEFAAIEARAEAATADDAARLLSALAATRQAMGDAAEAERLYRAAADRQPDDLRSRSALLDIAMQAGDVEKAKLAAAEIEKVSGSKTARSCVAQAGVRILQVRAAQERKELATANVELNPEERRLLDEARNLLIEAENDRPGWHLIQIYSAQIDGLKGDVPAAIDRLQAALKLGPVNPDVVRQLAGMLFTSNRLQEARLAIESLGPDGVTGLERMSAEMELRSGKLDEAVAIAERAVQKDSRNGGELLWLGQLLERSGKRERAAEVFKTAVEVAPDRADAWTALFSLQVATGRRRAAETTLERAAQALASPGRELVLAQGAESLGRLDEAERYFVAAAAAAPDDASIAAARAEFLVRVGRTAAARDSLQEVVDAKKDDAASRAMKAWARRRLAELTADRGTYSDLRRALALVDANAGPDGGLGSEDAGVKVALLANRAEPESWREAIEVIKSLRERQPLSIAQRLALASLLDKTGRWEDARQELMSVVSAPNAPPAFIGMVADKLLSHGEVANARAWVKRLQDAVPGSPVTLSLEARLAMADQDRGRAAELARRLMPVGDLPAERSAEALALAQLFEELEFPKPAEKLLAKYADRSPEGVVALVQFLTRQRRAAEALDIVERSWERLSLERVLSLGLEALRASPRSDEAAARVLALTAKGRRMDPDSILVPLVEAEVASLQGRPADAEAIYRGLLDGGRLDPVQKATVANNLAFHLAEPKTAAEAQRLIDDAIDVLGPHPDLLDTRGMVRSALGEHRDAIADLEQAVLQPSAVKFLHLGYVQLQAGDKSAARTALESGRKKGLSAERLSMSDRSRLRELEAALGVAPEQAGADEVGTGRG